MLKARLVTTAGTCATGAHAVNHRRPGGPFAKKGIFAAALVNVVLLSTVALAGEVSTSFEFTDVDGEFTVGTSPDSLRFENGEAKTVGILSLYRSGMNSWMIDAGQTGTITFETPAVELSLWFRDQTSSVGSILTVRDSSDTVIASFNGTTTFQEVRVAVSEADRIKRITLQNNGVSGYAVIDDFSSSTMTGDGPLADPIPGQIPSSAIAVRLETVATGMTAPNRGTVAPGQSDRLFVTDQTGILWAVDLAAGSKTVFLDVSSRLVSLGIGGPGTFDERGLLGVAFHPDYGSTGLIYTYTSEPTSDTADFSTMPPGETANHQSVVIEWQVPDPTNPASVVDPASARELLRIDQPQFNHDGGHVEFGPDGMLYVSLGDGGAADDQGVGHGTSGNGQDPSTVLGTLLRIDPSGTNSSNGRYGIPADNPFVGMAGFVEEIFAYGFRNPFRFSFDSSTGALHLADVGQNDIEEIDLVTAGGNYGWPIMEGSFFFEPNGTDPGFVTDVDPGGTDSLTRPIAEYDHDEGTAVIGGFVYRGGAIPQLNGRYVFGDFARSFDQDGRLFHLGDSGEVLELRIVGGSDLGLWLLGFGQDSSGELYVLANETGTPFDETGVVLRIAPSSSSPCSMAPLAPESCRQAPAGTTSLLIVNKKADSKDRLNWLWKKGAATEVSDFGDPVNATANYSFCVYDSSVRSQPLVETTMAPGGTCKRKPCWKTIGPPVNPKGFRLKNKTAEPGGIKAAKFKAGADGKAQVKIVGRGEKLNLPVPPLPLVTPVTAQLLIDDGTTVECWQARYSAAKKNKDEKFKAKTRAAGSKPAGGSGNNEPY